MVRDVKIESEMIGRRLRSRWVQIWVEDEVQVKVEGDGFRFRPKVKSVWFRVELKWLRSMKSGSIRLGR